MSDNESGQSLSGGQNNITTSPGQSMTSGHMNEPRSGQSLSGQNNITTSPGQSMTSGQTSGQSLSGQIAFPNRTTYFNKSSIMINQNMPLSVRKICYCYLYF